MDDMYNKGRNQHTIPGVLRDPSGKAVQPQPVSYETTPMPNDNAQSSLIYAQDSFGIPGGAQTFIKARPSASPVQPKQNNSRKLRSEHAYRLLAVAIVAVLISSSVLVTFIVTGGLGANAHNHANQPLTKAQVTAATRSTQGYTTTAPKPTPTQGSTQSPANSGSNPPPNPGSTPPPNSGGNSLPRFVNLPQQVDPNSNMPAPAEVQTQPGATVQIEITYGDPPYYTQLTADNTGMATFNVGFSGYHNLCGAAASSETVTATAPDSNGVQKQIYAAIPVVFPPCS